MPPNDNDRPNSPNNIDLSTLHPDFLNTPWTHSLLTSPTTTLNNPTSSPLLSQTLSTPHAIRAQLFLLHTTPAGQTQDIHLLSLAPGIDGAPGRAHGGLNSLILDHICGTCAAREGGESVFPPATAYLNVQYKAPVSTPAVVVARAWLERVEGRKVFVRGVLEGEGGVVFAMAGALFVMPRGSVL